MDPPLEISGPLWERAKEIFYDQVGDAKGENIKDSATLKQTLETLRQQKAKVSKEYGEHTIGKGKYSFTYKLDRIMKRLEILMQVGDAYMSAAPETVSLVWTGFRMIFTGFTKDADTCEFFTDAVDQMTDIMFIGNIFEKRFLKTQNVVDTAKAIADRILSHIPALYASVLTFAYHSRKMFKHGKILRSIMQWRPPELKNCLSDAQSKRNTLQDIAGIGFQDAALEALEGIQFDTSLIREISETIQEEVVPGIRDIQGEQARARKKEFQEDIEKKYNKQLEWLKTAPVADIALPGNILAGNRQKLYPGSADWVLCSPNFQEWRDTPHGSHSWLWGEGGYGKSFLLSAMIEHLQSRGDNLGKSKCHIIYFFCRKGDEATSVSKRIFLHLLIQLYKEADFGNPEVTEIREKCSQIVEEVWKQSKSDEKNNVVLVGLKLFLLPMFKKLAETIGKEVFVLIDGVDECTDIEELLEVLLELPKDSSIHLMCSSRPDIYHGIREAIPLNIEVSKVQTQEEIKKYVKARIKRILRFTKSEQSKIRHRIAERSEGSFRYAEVVLKSLDQPQAVTMPLKKLLNSLPDGMNALYRQSMRSLDVQPRKVLIVALRWLMCSSGQITLDLIADELMGRWESTGGSEEDDGDNSNDESDRYSDISSDSDDAIPVARDTREPTPLLGMDTNEFQNRDFANELRVAGREFVNVFNDGVIELQHNSIRDFVESEERAWKNEVVRCVECKKRFQETIAYEAGTKEGNLIICEILLKRLNNPDFQRRFIVGPTDTNNNGAVEPSDTDRTSEVPVNDDEITPAKHVPDVPDHHAPPSKEDIKGSNNAQKASPNDSGEILPFQEDSRFSRPSVSRSTSYNYSVWEERDIRYELMHWPQHFRQLEEIPDDSSTLERREKLYDGLEKFLRSDSVVYQHWLKKIYPRRTFQTFDCPLHVAARYGLLDLMRRWTSRAKYNINEKNENGDTPLHLACEGESGFRGIEWLCQMGADINVHNEQGATPLLLLLSVQAPFALIKKVIDLGAKPGIPDKDGVTALHWAARIPNPELFKTLLDYDGVDINAREVLSDETPLHWAFARSSPPTELLELMIKNGADVNAQDGDSQGPLYEACSMGDSNGARILLKHGADIDDDENVFGRTALHAAISADSPETVKVLLDGGADPTLKNNKSGQDALYQAVENGSLDIFNMVVDSLVKKSLLEEKCLQQESLHHWTPLHGAVYNRDREMTEILLRRADTVKLLAIKGRQGITALHVAAFAGFPELVLVLLNSGADPYMKDDDDDTPLDVALRGWTYADPFELPSSDKTMTIIALVDRAPETAKIPLLLHADIELEQITPICSMLKHFRDFEDAFGWTPLAVARQLKRQYKIDALLDGAEGDHEPKIVGKRPNALLKHAMIEFKGATPDYTLSEDGLEISTADQTTQEEGSLDIGFIVTADFPAPAMMPVFYYEVEVLAAPEERTLCLGFCGRGPNYSNGYLDTYWWETDTVPTKVLLEERRKGHMGLIHDAYIPSGENANPKGVLYSSFRRNGPLQDEYEAGYETGDIIGCGFDYEHDIVFYTKNGKPLPPFTTDVRGRLFPSIGLFSHGIRLRVNFGNDPNIPFKYHKWQEGAFSVNLNDNHTTLPAPDRPQPRRRLPEDAAGVQGLEIWDSALRERGFLTVPEYGLEELRSLLDPKPPNKVLAAPIQEPNAPAMLPPPAHEPPQKQEQDPVPPSTFPLPGDWLANFDTKSGFYYYIHLPTQTTQWEYPTASQMSLRPKDEQTD